jgi:hypothetical protein
MSSTIKLIKQIAVNDNQLQVQLDTYKLTLDDVGVFILDDDTKAITSLTEGKYPINLWYSTATKSIETIQVDLNHDAINNKNIRISRLQRIGA